MKVAAGFDPGSGMIEHLRELATAEPFKRFSIRMRSGKSYKVSRAEDISFTHYGSPQIREVRMEPEETQLSPKRALKPSHIGNWIILNVDAIDEIILL
jgi:hypothetical protein